MGAAMFKAFFSSMGTKGDEVIQRASTGKLPETVENNPVTINTDNIDVPKTADEILDPAEPVNRARQSDVSFDGRNYNLENITDEDELVRVIDFIGEKNNNFVDARGGGPESFDTVIEKAKKVELNELENIIGYKLGDGVTPARVAGSRILLQESADNLVKMAKTIQAGEADVGYQLKFRQAISSHVGIQQAVAGMAADSGRALNAWRIPVGANMGQTSSIYRTQLQQAVDRYGGEKAVNRLAEVILDSKDLTQVTKRLQKTHLANGSDLILEYWINGLLSSPATHVVNMSSNAIVASLAIPERFIATTFNKALKPLEGRGQGMLRQTDESLSYGEGMGQFFGIASGTRDGFRLAYKALKTGETSDPSMKYEARKYNAFSSENINAIPYLPNIKANSATAKGVDFFGDWVVRLPSRFLGAEDEFFKSVGYRMELNSLAYRTARDEGLRGDELVQRTKELVENPTEEIHLGATNMSRYQTFTNDLGPQGRGFQKAVNNTPALKIVLPFIRTPTNIIKYVAHRTPFNMQMWKDVQAGGVKRDVALARMSMGSSTLAVAYKYALEDKITGRGPDNKGAREALKLTGWQPYSYLGADGKYYSFNRADPVGMFLGLAADTAEVMKYAETQDGMDVALAAISAVAKNIENKSYMEGIANFIQAFEDPDRYGDAYMGRLASSFMIPYTAMTGQIERSKDPTLSEVYTVMDRVRARTPWLSGDLPPRRNIWGKPIVLQGGLGWDFVSPVYTSKLTNDPVADEIVRQEVPIRMHRKHYGTGKFRTEYTPEEYDRLVVLTGQEIKETTGPYKGLNLHDTLEKVMKSEAYLDEDMTDGPDGSRAAMLTDVINAFKQAAITKLLEDPSEPLHKGFLLRVMDNANKKGKAYDSSFKDYTL